MTLIISVVTQDLVLNASDRLLSQGEKEWDAVSNKAVLFFARDGIYTIAYRGLAFIGALPTDEFIVETLMGHPISGPIGKPRFTSLGERNDCPPIAVALNRLCSRLHATAASSPKRCRELLVEGLTVTVSGWRWSEPEHLRPKPIAWTIDVNRKRGSSGWSVDSLFLGWRTVSRPKGRERSSVISPAFNIEDAEHDEFTQKLLRANSPFDVKNAAVECIRAVSKRRPSVVGTDVMVIHIPRPRFRRVEIEFLPGSPRLATIDGEQLQPAYSPWILWSQGSIPPAQLILTRDRHQIEGFVVEIRGVSDPGDTKVIYMNYPQARRRNPTL